MWKDSKANSEAGVADLGPAVEVEQAMGAGQLAAHQPLPLHHAAGLPAMQVVDWCHHHHVCEVEKKWVMFTWIRLSNFMDKVLCM